MPNMSELLNSIPQIGKIEWIGLRSARRVELTEANEVIITKENGLEGDRYSGKNGKRQVTLIQAEHLKAVGTLLGEENAISPFLTRRNIVVSGLNLLALKDKQFRLGDEVILEGTGYCHPCSRMEEKLGPGGYNAMRGHGGITARVVQGGVVNKNANVQFLENQKTLFD